MNRILWLPIKYDITYRPYRHRNTSLRSVRVEVPFEIPVADDAIPVLDITPPPPLPKSTSSNFHIHDDEPSGPKHPHTLFLAGDRLLRKVMFGNGTPATPTAMAEYAAARPEDRKGNDFKDYPLQVNDYQSVLTAPFREEVEAELYDIHRDNRDDRINQERERARTQVAVMGDTLMKDAIEPVIQLQLSAANSIDNRTVYGVTVRVVPSGLQHAKKDAAIFRADEMELACAIAEQLAAQRKNKEVYIQGEVTVYRPEALQLDPWAPSVEKLGEALRYFRNSGFSRSTGTEAVRAWCDAQDAYNAFIKHGGDNRDTLIGLIERFLDLSKVEQDDDLTKLLMHLERFKALPERQIALEDEDLLAVEFTPAP